MYLKRLFTFLFLLTLSKTAPAQSKTIDSLYYQIARQKTDTVRIALLEVLSDKYRSIQKKDSSLLYAHHALELSDKINYFKGKIDSRLKMVFLLFDAGNYAEALEIGLESLQLAEQARDTAAIYRSMRGITRTYAEMNDHAMALEYARKNKLIVHSGYFKNDSLVKDRALYGYIIAMGEGFEGLNRLDSAMYYKHLAYETALLLKYDEGLALAGVNLANINLKTGKYDSAFSYYMMTIPYAKRSSREDLIAECYLGLGGLFQKKERLDSATYYGMSSLRLAQDLKLPSRELDAASLLKSIYAEQNRIDSAYKYLQLSVKLKDHLYNVEKIRQFQNLTFNETLRQSQLEQVRKEEMKQFKTNIKLYSLLAGLAALLLIAFILNNNNKQKQKVNTLLRQKNEEIQLTLTELKATQAQLVQREKMASLGELTAGIAHEIQNPLNFVNNFSSISMELVDEMEIKLEEGNKEEAMAIAAVLKENLNKITEHGNRADAIIKGMLLHSRSNKGQKEPTDINNLADEYLRLSYHGLRSKDKSFNVTMHTDFDKTLEKINIVPQDIGRVLLNLFNNAFYSVNEKKKLMQQVSLPAGHADLQDGQEYRPIVSVSTRKINDRVEIIIKDNGMGIPQNVMNKIFQPFFTTKPSGQGTGLGLSISYDIITKGHGGELRVETKEGEFSIFRIIFIG